jgi:hypothetical protein
MFVELNGKHQIEMAVSLYVLGLSYRTIGLILDVDCSTTYRWIKGYLDNANVTDVTSVGLLIPADEIFDFIAEKRKTVDYGKSVSKWIDQLLEIHKMTVPN